MEWKEIEIKGRAERYKMGKERKVDRLRGREEARREDEEKKIYEGDRKI